MNNSVLIIDDEKDICLLVENILKKKNIPVSFANTLSEGFLKLASSPPAILFLDINLPDGSGLDAIEIIKERYPSLKIVIISAYDNKLEHAVAEKRGADMFIGKPFNKELIYAAIDQLLSSQ